MSKSGECESVSLPIKHSGPPKVWKVVELKSRNVETPIRFSIQEIPEDRYEDVVDHMCTYFIADEPLCKCLNGKEDPDFVDAFRYFWKECIKQGLSVIALTENPDGGKPVIAGVNMLMVTFKEEKLDLGETKSKKALTVFKVVIDMCKRANIFEKYGVDQYMSAFGLSVHPSYRGAALGGHLLNARVDIGREYKISVTATEFTSSISQKLAERCGFETLLAENCDDIVDEKGNLIFPGIETKTLKVMARRLY